MHDEFTPTQIERFWSNIDRSGGLDACWLWQKSVREKGYGQVGFCLAGATKMFRAHRVAWILTHGPIPDDLLLCHTCHVPRCCNPAHLYVGTAKQNTADMMALGRHNRPHARFSDDEVREFRCRHAAGESTKSIADSVSHDLSAMSKLLRHLHYRHVA